LIFEFWLRHDLSEDLTQTKQLQDVPKKCLVKVVRKFRDGGIEQNAKIMKLLRDAGLEIRSENSTSGEYLARIIGVMAGLGDLSEEEIEESPPPKKKPRQGS
jgi:hypothetical protein